MLNVYPPLAAESHRFAAVETGCHLLGPRERAAAAAGNAAPAPRGPVPPAGGRTRGRGQGGRRSGGPALECSFLGPERLRTGVEDSSGWGFAPLPPPHPRAPFQALSGRFQNRAGKFKAQRGACAVGRGQWKKMKARNVSRAFLTRQTADTCGVSTDSFKDGVTVTRVLRRLLRCVTRDPARGEEKAYFLGWCVFKTGRRAVISWV